MKGKRFVLIALALVLVLAMGVLHGLAGEHTHSWPKDWEEIKKADCENSGIRRKVCTCGEAKYEYPAALGHKWGTYVETLKPTCTAEGHSTATCERDNTHKDVRPLSKVPHQMTDWTPGIIATCTTKGTETRKCINCVTQNETRDVPAKGHNWTDWLPDTAATCLVKGKNIRKCLNGCGIPPETQELPALGHQWTEWSTDTPASCTLKGSAKRICLRGCGVPAETQELPALGHDWGTWTEDTPATCTAKGTAKRICMRGCGVPAETQELPALGHKWGNWEPDTPATCTVKGKTIRKCDRGCGVLPDSQELPALGHDYRDKKVTKEATCAVAGEISEECKRGDHTRKTVIPPYGKDSPNGHKMGTWMPDTPSTCSVPGKEKRTCDNGCGRVEFRELKTLPHTSDEIWVVVRHGDLSNTTKEATKCTVCGKEAKTKTYAPRGIKLEQMTWAFGVPAAKAGNAAAGDAMLIHLQMANDGTYSFPLITPDQRSVGRAVVTVANGTVRVSMEKNGESAALLRYRFWQLFPNAEAVTQAQLEGTSLPFDQAVSVNGDSCVIVVHTKANYYTSGVNTPFNDGLAAWEGQSYKDIADQMLLSMGEGGAE